MKIGIERSRKVLTKGTLFFVSCGLSLSPTRDKRGAKISSLFRLSTATVDQANGALDEAHGANEKTRYL